MLLPGHFLEKIHWTWPVGNLLMNSMQLLPLAHALFSFFLLSLFNFTSAIGAPYYLETEKKWLEIPLQRFLTRLSHCLGLLIDFMPCKTYS